MPRRVAVDVSARYREPGCRDQAAGRGCAGHHELAALEEQRTTRAARSLCTNMAKPPLWLSKLVSVYSTFVSVSRVTDDDFWS